MSTTDSVIRDLFTEDVAHVIVDSKKLWKEIRGYVNAVSPHLLDKIELYKHRDPIFDHYGVEKEIAACLSRKVWMKSGGYIIIEQTEAMVVVDVNSGRYAAKREQEQNSLRTNLEAAREVTRQLRLRDIGGIIVVDFIDLEDDRNRKKVYDELRKEFPQGPRPRYRASDDGFRPRANHSPAQSSKYSLKFQRAMPCVRRFGFGAIQIKRRESDRALDPSVQN